MLTYTKIIRTKLTATKTFNTLDYYFNVLYNCIHNKFSSLLLLVHLALTLICSLSYKQANKQKEIENIQTYIQIIRGRKKKSKLLTLKHTSNIYLTYVHTFIFKQTYEHETNSTLWLGSWVRWRKYHQPLAPSPTTSVSTNGNQLRIFFAMPSYNLEPHYEVSSLFFPPERTTKPPTNEPTIHPFILHDIIQNNTSKQTRRTAAATWWNYYTSISQISN